MADHRNLDDRHWSELTGAWYFVSSIADHWDHIRHDVPEADIPSEVSGMFILHRDPLKATAAPTTLAGWRLLAEMAVDDEDGERVCCVGRVVGGVCVPIGGEEDDEDEDDSDSDVCDFCGADRHDGCSCHGDILGFPEGCPSD